ncbi:MAG: hypothetical protein R3F61_35675 [Myxococcota bacterium]
MKKPRYMMGCAGTGQPGCELPDAAVANCPHWTEGQEVRSAEQALCRATKAGLPVEGSLRFYVREFGQTNSSPDVGTHWGVYAVHQEACSRKENHTAGFMVGIEAKTGRVVTPKPWRFEDDVMAKVPACGNTIPSDHSRTFDIVGIDATAPH